MKNTGCIHREKGTLDAYSESVPCSAFLLECISVQPPRPSNTAHLEGTVSFELVANSIGKSQTGGGWVVSE